MPFHAKINSTIVVGLCIAFYAYLYWLPNTKQTHPCMRAMYFWESERSYLSDNEVAFLRNTENKRLYLKFFEVDHNAFSGDFPIAKSTIRGNALPDSIEIVPTVFIRNAVFKHGDKQSINQLVENMMFLLNKRYHEQFPGFPKYKELQIDCDWTISTRQNYHAFLKAVKLKLPKGTLLSATLRLYPYKFPDKMGVLPVDRAMLMCYNLIPPLESGNRNSILDLSELDKYLSNAASYPVPLDVAFPVFSNALVFKNKFFHSMLHAPIDNLKKCTIPFKGNLRMVAKDTTVEHVYLRKGDLIKLEAVSPKRLLKAVQLVHQKVDFSGTPVVSLFQLNESQLKQYDDKTLGTLYATFSW
jgi:hypothetical protein